MNRITRALDATTRGLDATTRGLDAITRGLDATTRGLDATTRALDAHQSGSSSLQSRLSSEQDYRDYTMYRTKFYLYPQKELLHEVVSCLSHNLQNRVGARIVHRTPARREGWGGATLCFVGCLSAYAILDIFLSPFHFPWIGFLSS